jgi:hypothetical protein
VLAAGFDSTSSHVGFVVDKEALWQMTIRVLQLPLPILIPPTAPHSSSVVQGWYNRPTIGRRTNWTPSHLPPRIVHRLVF